MNGSLTKRAGRMSLHVCRPDSLMHVAVVGLVVAQTGPALWASDAVETAGDVLEAVLPAAAAGVGLWQKDWDGLLHFGYSLGNSLALTEGTKALVERERPDLSEHDSYVSGHTATAFSGAAFLDRRYLSDRPLWLRAVPYGAAAFVGYSRYEADKHHVGDIVAGAMLGAVPVHVFTAPWGREVTLAPTSIGGGGGVSFRINWPGERPEGSEAEESRSQVFGYATDQATLFTDPHEPTNPTTVDTYAQLVSEALGFRSNPTGWVMTRTSVHWRFLDRQELAIEVPYVEADLAPPGNFQSGLGDLSLRYAIQAVREDSPDRFLQGVCASFTGYLPTGQASAGLGADAALVAPCLSVAMAPREAVGVFLKTTFLASVGDTAATPVPTDTLYLPVPWHSGDPRTELRNLVVESPLVVRFAQRLWVEVFPSFSYDFGREWDDLAIGGAFGVKISDAASFMMSYAASVAGHEELKARLQFLTRWSF